MASPAAFQAPLKTPTAGAVDPTRLMMHIAEFAKRLKLSGAPKKLESFRYLEATMQGFGYGTNLVLHDAYISLPRTSRVTIGFDSGVYMTTMKDTPGNEDLDMTGPLIKGAMLATEVAMGMRKNEPELKAIFDKAIREATADGTIKAVSTKWSKLDLTPTLPPQ